VGFALAILALLVVGALVGTALNFGSLFLGIPLVLLFIGAIVGKETMERQQRILRMKRFRREARAQKVEFEPADKRTLV
jgi:Sec-independent protein secretion pathway component TatC